MYRLILGCLAILGCLMAGGAAAAQPPVRVISWELTPYHFQQAGPPQGFTVEMVAEIARRLDTPVQWDMQPFARGVRGLEQAGPGVALLTLVKTPDRADRFRWVGPLVQERIGLVMLRDRQVSDLTSARRLNVGVVNGTLMHQRLMAQNFPFVEVANDDSLNLLRLTSGRIGAWAVGERVARQMVAEAGQDWDRMTMVLQTPVEPYLAFSLASDPALVARWQGVLETMAREGRLRAILAKYGQPDLLN